jgi:hypothetical protein
VSKNQSRRQEEQNPKPIIIGYDIKTIIPAPPGWEAIIVDEWDVVAQDEGAVGFTTYDVAAFAVVEHRFKDGRKRKSQKPEALVADATTGDLEPVKKMWGEDFVAGVAGPSRESRERLSSDIANGYELNELSQINLDHALGLHTRRDGRVCTDCVEERKAHFDALKSKASQREPARLKVVDGDLGKAGL